MTQRIEQSFLNEIKTPSPVEPEVFTDASAAVAALQKLYERNTGFLRNAFEKVARGEIRAQRYRAFYPEICLSTSSFAHVDSRLAFGHVSTPGDYSATITRPDLFDHYLTEQIRLLMRNHGVTVTVRESSTPIPIHFAFMEGTYVEASVASAFQHPLRDLFDVPDLADRNLQASFDAFPWRTDEQALRAWQRGRTGYPIVDAGMRELWRTGIMHNRVRMVAASFLVKHLLIDWREGERWFWDTLVDADPASNPANWQWVAGSGADAAPYFRVFNPILQGEKFDPDGAYVRRWVPELARLPAALIHQPWRATPLELTAAQVELGNSYPEPIVDHKEARERALRAYAKVRGS